MFGEKAGTDRRGLIVTGYIVEFRNRKRSG
jgi:hypothetical protein